MFCNFWPIGHICDDKHSNTVPCQNHITVFLRLSVVNLMTNYLKVVSEQTYPVFAFKVTEKPYLALCHIQR